MKSAKYSKEVDALLAGGKAISTTDFMEACPGMPAPSVYSKIRKLITMGRISRIGQGLYLPVHKPSYRCTVTPWMREVANLIQEECVGLDFCIRQEGANLIVEVAKSDLAELESCLKDHHIKVANSREAAPLLSGIEGFILIGHLVSDAPLVVEEGLRLPSIEKDLVDMLAKKSVRKDRMDSFFQKNMEVYPVNRNRLSRYAARRGLSEELKICMDALDHSRLEMFSLVQNYLAGTCITKAWVFGSFARMEETPESDLDLLVDYDKSAKVSLLDIIRNQLDLEHLIHRPVDLITNGSLKPFAVQSANKDKYLIYER